MEQLSLKAHSRDITGKSVRFLRREGIIPLHLFGHGIESVTLQSETTGLEKVLTAAGETRLISLTINKERKTRPVLVREIQRNPITGILLHVDLYQVKMDEKIESEVPLVLTGKAPALDDKSNMMLQELNVLNIESLPDKIPAQIKVDISSLTAAGQVKRVRDLSVEPDIMVTTNPDTVVVAIIMRHEEKKVEEKPVTEEVKVPVAEEPAKDPSMKS
jgi:large subunit ribosomal protein L25